MPTEIKQVWAVELDILGEIDRICSDHGLSYFAAWGTLIGAVRHGGIIPWDDDIDIWMKREDYIRFREVADDELPEGYVIHDYERKENHHLFLTRVVGNDRICFDEGYLGSNYNTPWLCCVDIFLLDYLYADEEKEKKRSEETLKLIAQGEVEPFDHKRMIRKYREAEKRMGEVPEAEAERIGQIFPWVLKGGRGFDKNWFEKQVWLPFEDTRIPVPCCYDKVLKESMGDYLVVHKSWNGHDYPFFEKQKAEMKALAKDEWPEFSMKEEYLRRVSAPDSPPLKKTALEYLRKLAKTAETGAFMDSQNLAIELGEMLEKEYSPSCAGIKKIIAALEEWCEIVFQCSEDAAGESELKEAYRELEQTMERELLQKEEVLFLSTGGGEWKNLSDSYEKECMDPKTRVSLIALPLFFKDPLGRILPELVTTVGPENYPKELGFTDYRNYHPELHCPKRIYFQNPYDGENPCLTVPPSFFADRLRRVSKELILIPYVPDAEIRKEEERDRFVMSKTILTPGVLLADRVVVPTESIRELYVEKLTAFAGKDTKEQWEKKITVQPTEQRTDEHHGSKKLLFVIGAEIQKAAYVQSKFEILENAGDKIQVTVCQFPSIDSSENLTDTIRHWAGKLGIPVFSYDNVDKEKLARDFDAYYGSPSPLVPLFTMGKKPVMIAAYELGAE